MGSTLGSYEIARSGMLVSERSLFVTGHNMANATTTGYVRQQAISASSAYSNINNSKMQVGQGAHIQQTRQIRNVFLDKIFRSENTSLGYWETREQAISDMETILADPALSGVDDQSMTGLSNVMNQFWDSWQELSKEPSSLTIRALVRQRGVTLVDQLNQMGHKLDEMQMNLNDEIRVRVDELNALTSNIAELNQSIAAGELAGDNANDYRDRRNLLLDQLTKLADVQIYEMKGGWVQISLGGEILVNRSESTKISVTEGSTFSVFYDLKHEGTGNTVEVKNGLLKGLFDSRGNDFYCLGLDGSDAVNPVNVENLSVSDVKSLLNTMVKNLTEELNILHGGGTDLRGDPGIDFFVPVDPSRPMGIGNISINPMIGTDVNLIAASASGADAASGNNENALLIANLKNSKFLGQSGQKQSPSEYYNNVILSLGTSGQIAAGNAQNQSILVFSADNARKAITDVSMDEELSNMMKFQFSYGASSRVMSVIDEMVDTVVNRMGLAGR